MADTTVAQTILAQYGGNHFAMVTGANTFSADKNSLTFRVPKAKKSITHVVTTLMPSDTYKVEFLNCRLTANGHKREIVATYTDVYSDQLQDIFEEETGLYATLFARR